MDNLFRFISLAIVRSFDFLVTLITANKSVLQESEVTFVKQLQTNFSIILKEYKNEQSKKMQSIQDFYKVKTDINYDENWKAVPIVLFNYLFTENALRYPETYKLIKSIPGCSAAMFSVLGPGKYIPPHKGIYKGIYRCLFTLEVESNTCWIRVGENKIYFKENEAVIFDETFEHEVKNESAYPRVVLYLDIYRKLPFPLNSINALLYFAIRKSPFVRNILKEYKKLESTTFTDFKSEKSTLSI